MAANTIRSTGALGRLSAHAVLILLSLASTFPFIWMFLTSIKPNSETFAWPPRLIPEHPTLDAYVDVLAQGQLGRWFLNSLIVAGGSTIIVLLTSVAAGYVFAKHKFPGKALIFGLLLSTAIVPFETFMLPLFGMVVKAGLINTYPAMMLPHIVMAFGIFFLRQNIDVSIPDELLDAARIDGCTEFGILVRIVFPLCRGPMSALAVFSFIQCWTAFIWPLLVVNRADMFNMEVGLSNLQQSFSTDHSLLMAGSVLSVLPIIVLFAVLRRQILEGIALTGLKE